MEIDVTQIIIAVIGLVFTATIIPLIKAGFAWLRGKTQNEALLTALDEAERIADNVVLGLQQTVVGALKEKSEDGKLTAEEAKEIAKLAVDQFLSDISTQTLNVLMDNADDITAYIKNLLESRLAKIKLAV